VSAPTATAIDQGHVPGCGGDGVAQDIISDAPPNLMRTPVASNMSNESQYTTQSAVEFAEVHDKQSSRTQSRTGEDAIGDEKCSVDTKNTELDCEDEDIALSPGFDAIQALASTNRFENMDHRTL
jgi:hypothetical protein